MSRSFINPRRNRAYKQRQIHLILICIVFLATAFHARVRGSVPGLGGLKETKNVSSPSTCESQYCGEPP